MSKYLGERTKVDVRMSVELSDRLGALALALGATKNSIASVAIQAFVVKMEPIVSKKKLSANARKELIEGALNSLLADA